MDEQRADIMQSVKIFSIFKYIPGKRRDIIKNRRK